ncbi:hypothetical protein HYX16_01780 [Candidatus Woesearchaeota archaeon]|nr:hypothetical protein [Candidatus Woesearchaeota archaeon]
MAHKIQFNISNKLVYSLLILIIILALGLGAYAFGTSTPSVFGHSSGEVQVNVEGKSETLQEAINNLDLMSGWFLSSNENIEIKYVKGNNVNCPSGFSFLSRNWLSNTCTSCFNSCTTSTGWGDQRFCMYKGWQENILGPCTKEVAQSCYSNSWSEALCIKIN